MATYGPGQPNAVESIFETSSEDSSSFVSTKDKRTMSLQTGVISSSRKIYSRALKYPNRRRKVFCVLSRKYNKPISRRNRNKFRQS